MMLGIILAVPLAVNLLLLPGLNRPEATSNIQVQDKVKEEVRERIQEKQQVTQNRLDEAKKVRVRMYVKRMTERISAAIARLERLIARMEARIAKINEEGEDLDTSGAEASIEKAKGYISQAKTELEKVASDAEAFIESDGAPSEFSQVVKSVNEIKRLLVEAHRQLVLAIGDLKGLRVGETQ